MCPKAGRVPGLTAGEAGVNSQRVQAAGTEERAWGAGLKGSAWCVQGLVVCTLCFHSLCACSRRPLAKLRWPWEVLCGCESSGHRTAMSVVALAGKVLAFM